MFIYVSDDVAEMMIPLDCVDPKGRVEKYTKGFHMYQIVAVGPKLEPFKDWFLGSFGFNENHELACEIIRKSTKSEIEMFLDFLEVNPPDLSEDQNGGYDHVMSLMKEAYVGESFPDWAEPYEVGRGTYGHYFRVI